MPEYRYHCNFKKATLYWPYLILSPWLARSDGGIFERPRIPRPWQRSLQTLANLNETILTGAHGEGRAGLDMKKVT